MYKEKLRRLSGLFFLLFTVNIFPQTYTLLTYTHGNGTVIKEPDKSTYNAGEKVTLTEIPDEGYAFDHWEGSFANNCSMNPKTITMDGNKIATAFFKKAMPAFPGAEGGGMYAVGGRGGAVIEVTNLNSYGEGSFRRACLTKGPRTIVFRVGGTIDLKGFPITVQGNDRDYLTIAGQTAPGGGIQIKGGSLILRINEFIVRYMRFRLGAEHGNQDALQVSSPNRQNRKRNGIVDHCSIYWGIDETCDFGQYFDNLTMQWSIVAEGLYKSLYDVPSYWKPWYDDGTKKYWAHSRGIMVTEWSRNVSIHHCVIYNSDERNPLIQSSDCDVVNNVIVAELRGMLQTLSGPVRTNWIGNYFRSYEEYSPICIYEYNNGWNVGSGSYYKDNYDPRDRPSDSYPERTIRGFIWDRRGFADMDSAYKFNYPPITTEPVRKAYHTVLNNVGANYPESDSADIRVINNILNGDDARTLVNDPSEVGGFPTIEGGTPPTDSDHDGMPDKWETAHGLNPNDASDRNGTNLSSEGYTNLEVYLNGIVNSPVSVKDHDNNLNLSYELKNYPNPFNPTTTIYFTIPKAGKVNISVYNLLGQQVAELVNKEMNVGTHKYVFDGSNLTSGIYFYKLESNGYTSVKKMMMLK